MFRHNDRVTDGAVACSPQTVRGANRNARLQLLWLQKDKEIRDDYANTRHNTNHSVVFDDILQYILQHFFKININQLHQTKLVDFTVDDAKQNSLKLKNQITVVGSTDVTQCPLFALSLSLFIKLKLLSQSITEENFNNIQILTSDEISLTSIASVLTDNGNETFCDSSQFGVERTSEFTTPKELVNLIFPWLPFLKQNLLLSNLTDYSLFCLCDLFEFLGVILIQGLILLSKAKVILPNILHLVNDLVPTLFANDFFISAQEKCTCQVKNNLSDELLNTFKVNKKRTSKQMDDARVNLIESQFLSLSKNLISDSESMKEEIDHLQINITAMSQKCKEILRLQKELSENSNRKHNSKISIRDRIDDLRKERATSIVQEHGTVKNIMISPLVQNAELNDRSTRKSLDQNEDINSLNLAPINMLPSVSNQMRLLTPKLPHSLHPDSSQTLKLLNHKVSTPGEQYIFSPSPRDYDLSFINNLTFDNKSPGVANSFDTIFTKQSTNLRLPPITNYDDNRDSPQNVASPDHINPYMRNREHVLQNQSVDYERYFDQKPVNRSA